MILRRYLLLGFLALVQSGLAVAGERLVFSAVEGSITVEIARRVLTRAYERLDIPIEIRELPGARALYYSNSGQTDGEAFRVAGIEKRYSNLRRIDVPIFTNSLYLFVKEGREFSVNGWESVPPDYRVGYQRGIQIIEKNTLRHCIRTHRARHTSQLFAMLKFGRVDAIIAGGDQTVLSAQELRRDHIVQLQPAIDSHPLYHYVHVNQADLIPRITAVLREMEAGGELRRIQQEVEAAYSPSRCP